MTTRNGDRARRHTRFFLEWAGAASPVFLSADVDMTGVEGHRAAARARGRRYSPVSYVLLAGGRVLARHPEANAAAVGGARLRAPRTVRFGRVSAKLAVDRRTDGGRAVVTEVIEDVDGLTLDGVQERVDRCREGGDRELPGAGAARLLGGLPAPLGRLVFRAAMAVTARRPALLGTFAVSSLGHRRVDTFLSYGGTAVTLTAGRTTERAVVRDGHVSTAPVMRLGLTFDHRVIDGAAAADILDGLVHLLEGCDADLPGGWDDPRHGDVHRTPDQGDGSGGTLAAGSRRPARARQRGRPRPAGGLAARRPGRP